MNYEDNPDSVKYYVKRYLLDNKENIVGKKVVDLPAGNGVTSRIVKEIGGEPIPFDLFPEYFLVDGLECKRANIADGIPLSDDYADILLCQEGIEHFPDQLGAFQEFNRVLIHGGKLLITTPNYSNLRAKLSYLLSESERFNSILPPNEIDSVWMSNRRITGGIYFGHIFLIGIQKLRILAKLAGFKIRKVYPTKLKSTSMLLFPIFYPYILISNWITFKKNLKKHKDSGDESVKDIYDEVFNLAIRPRILVDSHLMVEFEKEAAVPDVAKSLRSVHEEFGET